MKKQRPKKKILFKIVISSLVFCGLILVFPNKVYGQWIQVWDPQTWEVVLEDLASDVEREIAGIAREEAAKQKQSLASRLFHATLGKALSTLAYDTATWLGSGGEGQKPMFITEGWDEYLTNIADNAAGDFLETLGRYGPAKFNLCEPDFALKIKIGLGLTQYARPRPPVCTFTEMKKNWEEELRDPNFLTKFQDMFEPQSSDLGIALSLQTGIMEQMSTDAERMAQDREETEGWLDLRSRISGLRESYPGYAKEAAIEQGRSMKENIAMYTGDALIDAANIFLNQLAITAFDRAMRKLAGDKPYTEPYGGDYGGFADYEAGPGYGGIAGAKERFRELIEPNFNIRGDYNILTELTMCPDPNKAGPTHCVIEDKFRQAIENRMTVGQAIEQGYLNANGVFGFTADGLEPPYIEGYPYRSMIILRKFRIIPVGWEVAAQYIKDFLGETRNLGDLVACFANDDNYEGYYAAWCDGLVDPSWVLKAPLNYCRREGPGPEIISEQVIGQDDNSFLAIGRNDNYCADEQSCIKEKNDGSCELYGYCTEERSQWNFNGNSCDPKYNTCQTFRSREGSTVSYLENTLDYSICNVDNVGCGQYVTSFASYNVNTDEIVWNDNEAMYFDQDAEECSQTEEGCHEFIRTKAGRGANFLTNSSFEENIVGSIWEGNGTQVDDGYDGFSGLQMSANITKIIVVGPSDYSISGEVYTLSLYAKNCGAGNTIELGNTTTELNSGGDWQYYQVTHFYPLTAIGNQVTFTINSNSCLIDAIKLERGDIATNYSDYRDDGLVYQRLAPEYLNCSGAGDPIQCYNFVRECTRPEVGCELYTSVKDSFSVPAKVTINDYCPAECVGYDEYLQSETYFEDPQPAYFIPDLTQSCSAQSVGCDEFTNLDKLELGGEAREYYSQLKLCRKPDSECAQFYTWEGSAETGYQLRIHGLQADGSGPYLTNAGQYNGQDCNDISDYDLTNNPMCREFYNTNGEVFYRFYPYIITCSENCHPYRRTEVDNPGIGTCLNGGAWNNEHEACIYMAIPGEGISCSAAQAGCREYSGSAGANMRILFTNDFEDGTNQGWTGANSNESIMVGEHSLAVSGNSTYLIVDHLVARDKSYVVSFMAKSNGANNFTQIGFGESAAEILFDLGSAVISGEWRLYEFNLARLNNAAGDYEVSDEEKIFIEANGNFYIDDIRLTEIIDRYYLIKDSWQIPEACLQDIQGNPVVPEYNLGCEAYQDRDNNTHYLRQFSQLCQESAVGCELMIDTYNSTDYASITSNTDPAVNVPEDSFIYVVYNTDKVCYQRDKGCQRLGAVYQYATTTLYSDIYLKNDPDRYNEILCDQLAVGCEEWNTNEGNSYFKDPGDMVCQWRQAYQESYGWYKKKINRCDDNGNGTIEAGLEITVCLDSSDCGGLSCVLDNNEYACPISPWLTFGFGGAGNRIEQPLVGWVGLCPAAQAGCGEIIDPISKPSVNLIFNSNLDEPQDVDGNFIPDGWSNFSQEVGLSSYTLYRLALRASNVNSLTITCPDPNYLYELSNNNYLANASLSYTIPANPGEVKSKLVYSGNNTSCTISVGNYSGQVELKKALVDYQIRQDLDYESCNGMVDYEEGCVLFNERKQDGVSLAMLNWDADLTIDDGNGVAPQAGIDIERDANTLFKVSPDRVCNKWLACRSYIKDEHDNNVCFDIGLCDSVDEDGQCNSFVITEKDNQIYPSAVDANKISNFSGYTKVGYSGGSLNSDYYPLGAMEQFGEIAQIDNGGFEMAGENGYPIGWSWIGGVWDKDVFKVIDNPITAQTEGIDYPVEGRNFLKLGSTYSATSEFVNVVGGIEYILTAYINTIDLSIGEALVKVEAFNSIGVNQGERLLTPNVSLTYRSHWTFKLGKFTTNSNDARVKVTLYSTADTVGNFYFDDIRIRPALESKDLTPFNPDDDNFWYTPQSCRLYPENDSLSCQYYDDSGKRQKGWLGYCLEYDHYPGSMDACILWYPIDKVKGEGIEEGAGYTERFSLYYCLDFKECQLAEARKTVFASGGCGCRGFGDHDSPEIEVCDASGCTITSVAPDGYYFYGTGGTSYCGHDCPEGSCGHTNCQNIVYLLRPNPGEFVVNAHGVDWYLYNGSLITLKGTPYSNDTWNEADHGLRVYCPDEDLFIDLGITEDYPYNIIPLCTRLTQTVTQVGENKYWSGRVYYGSNYEFPCNIGISGASSTDLICSYDSDYEPFGSIVYPVPVNNPYEWDSKENISGNQPLFYELPNESLSPPYQPRAGQFHDQNEIMRLFAQSYGIWEWDSTSSNYISISGLDWGPPTIICDGPTRASSSDDYCAYLPQISNILVNNGSGNEIINKSGFINFTFNSLVDSQQLPLIMYAVDWGDGEHIIVTGVEMRGRPNIDNPHSLYHLYSYWDLKAKEATGVPGIACQSDCAGYGAVGACCVIKPNVKIKDNWGWCNAGIDDVSGFDENPTSIDDCNQWEVFVGWIVVTER